MHNVIVDKIYLSILLQYSQPTVFIMRMFMISVDEMVEYNTTFQESKCHEINIANKTVGLMKTIMLTFWNDWFILSEQYHSLQKNKF